MNDFDLDSEWRQIERDLKSLDDPPEEATINGARPDSNSYFSREPKKITVIRGFPPCPLCNKVLSLRHMPGYHETHWHCTGCGTQWEVIDLIKAINDVIELSSNTELLSNKEAIDGSKETT